MKHKSSIVLFATLVLLSVLFVLKNTLLVSSWIQGVPFEVVQVWSMAKDGGQELKEAHEALKKEGNKEASLEWKHSIASSRSRTCAVSNWPP